jgi:hypothetical protein
MFLVVNSMGQLWDGLGWSQQGKPFLSVGSATRSLYEEGEDIEEIVIQEVLNDPA